MNTMIIITLILAVIYIWLLVSTLFSGQFLMFAIVFVFGGLIMSVLTELIGL